MQVHEKFNSRGLEIIGIGYENEGAIQGFINKHGVTYGTAKVTPFNDLYGLKGFPTAWAVDPEGKVIWTGHPGNLSEDMIEEWVKDLIPTKITRKVAPEVKEAVEAYNKGEYGKALNLAQAVESTEDKAREDAGYVTELVGKRIEQRKERASRLRDEGDFLSLAEQHEQDARSFKGCEFGDGADKEAKKIKKSREYKDCETAEKTLQKLLAAIDQLPAQKAKKELEKIAKKYPDTPAGKKAQKLMEKYE